MPYASTPKRANNFRRRLAAWFRCHGRDLPWRRTRDPYAVVVAEFMLQQTQVSRVLDFYQPFLNRYPSFEHLAAARPQAVREA
jgi:A/G-specific adenine glycosylase